MPRLLAALAVLLPALTLSLTQSADTTVRPYARVAAFGGATPPAHALTPAQFHRAYQLPATSSASATQTIGIVDAFGAPTLEHDLGVYDKQFGLPACTAANGCLTVVNQDGGTTLPAGDNGWQLETSLDVETAHAICQNCKILLVEGMEATGGDLAAAEDTAVRMGATEISNSWGSTEVPGLPPLNYPGVAVLASTGDSGYGVGWPASAPHVVAAGGTSLSLNADGSWKSEAAWNESGSGCSTVYHAVWWQTRLAGWHRTGCGTHRLIADVSADADPATGAAVYDSNPYYGESGWMQIGGTSLSSPLLAGVIALAGGAPAGRSENWFIYQHRNSTDHHDITHGSTGPCGTSACNAGKGIDGPTGEGSPRGLAWFGGAQ